MHELACAVEGGQGVVHTIVDVPVLSLMVASGVLACVVTYRTAQRLAMTTTVDIVTYHGLRALGLYCGWLVAWSIAALLAPCWFLNLPGVYIGLWYWSGVPLAVTQLAWWLGGHAKRKESSCHS